jgi:hypothetical protein
VPRVVFDPAASSIVVDLLLEAADGHSSVLMPVVLDTGASLTIIATDIMAQLGYDPANPALDRQRIVTGSGIEICSLYKSAISYGYRPKSHSSGCLVSRPAGREWRGRASWNQLSPAF